jgi:AraC-like DNA-binding protein
MIRSGPLFGVPGLLNEFGLDAERIVRGVGLDPAVVSDPESLIPIQTGGALLSHCIAATGCQHFGLLAAKASGSAGLGLLGLACRHQADVQSALRLLTDGLLSDHRAAVTTLQLKDGFAQLGYVLIDPEVQAADQIHDCAIGIATLLMRQLCNPAWNPAQVLLQRRRPTNPKPWQAFFRVTPEFDSEQSAITFPVDLLTKPVPGADPVLGRILAKRVLDGCMEADAGLTDEVERLVKPMLGQRFSVERAATMLGVHRRTLARRLAEEETSYREVHDRARFDRARQMMQTTDVPLAEIAVLLGYSDASAFTRAFRRWSGMSPSMWRRMAEKRAGSAAIAAPETEADNADPLHG